MQQLETTIAAVKKAQALYAAFTQEQVDAIFKAAALAANKQRIPLAKLAVQETGMGITEDKVIKNHFASEIIYNKYKDMKTVGVIDEDSTNGITTIASSMGTIAGIIPCTNPTSTTIFKALIALKTGNGIIFAPHPRSKACTIAAAKVVLDAAVKAGAPEKIISWVAEPSLETTTALMKHKDIKMILATGGPGMVKAAYSSGTPSLGVGSGNTPVVVAADAEIELMVSSVLLSKSFDNGVICASEQAVIVDAHIYDAVKNEFIKRGAYILTAEEKAKFDAIMMVDGHIAPAIVGQSVQTLGKMAGVELPANTRVIIGEVTDITTPFAHEKLSPILALYKVDTFEQGTAIAKALIELGGLGHTAGIYTHATNKSAIEHFTKEVCVGRILINTPASHGAIGDIYNGIDPSLTLGCGTWGGSGVSENVGPKHLLNIKTVADRVDNMLWYKIPSKIYFKPGSLPIALRELKGKKRAFIVTDKPLYDLGVTDVIKSTLNKIGVDYEVFTDVQPNPTLSDVKKGLDRINSFKPDVIIAIGGGSPMDAAKLMWLQYEQPDINFEDIATRFLDIYKRIVQIPALGNKAILVTVPTTSGTGSEVTPFAVIIDDATGIKYPLADYALTPTMAIIDPQLVQNMPKSLTAFGGIDALTHALESIASIVSTEFTEPQALQAIKLLFDYLPAAYAEGAANPKAREKVHYAATLAGMSFANAFLGICHSMAHALGREWHVPHGLANALLISHVVKYNAVEAPFRMGAFSQYAAPKAIERYARIAEYLGIGFGSDDMKVASLIEEIECLKQQVGIPNSLKKALGDVTEEAFLESVDRMAETAWDDQCTSANPRQPLLTDLRDLYLQAYYGVNRTA